MNKKKTNAKNKALDTDQETANELIAEVKKEPLIPTSSKNNEEIASKLEYDLSRNPHIVSSLLKVSVADGNAYVKGKVHSLNSKQSIDEVIKGYPEIKNIVNETIIALS
ncbi:BON domain-containing protein [Desulfonispora thiosulfatigenes DSM 11270]|uniref:BON domain-containing protein n=1 Tax=Desulfonispora thiosulfatigenes DSM 11270 TaxID=656914 RepID=A0A1W1V321_DESTI|nr:BON domain-containing protein [Desulfonispora thiosulfatigenes]SMB87777.1 BON domain-containing protein [Desulfonispora thiosulfatigenes DSM 11270]